MSSIQILLTEHDESWLANRLREGPFADVSEYVRALIQRDREIMEQVEAVRAIVDEGDRDIAEGRFTEVSSIEELEALISGTAGDRK